MSLFQGGSTSNLNMNLYATKKTVAEGMLDVALFLANITHMKSVIEQGAGYRYSMRMCKMLRHDTFIEAVSTILKQIQLKVEQGFVVMEKI